MTGYPLSPLQSMWLRIRTMADEAEWGPRRKALLDALKAMEEVAAQDAGGDEPEIPMDEELYTPEPGRCDSG
jgi:hypothetical protein